MLAAPTLVKSLDLERPPSKPTNGRSWVAAISASGRLPTSEFGQLQPFGAVAESSRERQFAQALLPPSGANGRSTGTCYVAPNIGVVCR